MGDANRKCFCYDKRKICGGVSTKIKITESLRPPAEVDTTSPVPVPDVDTLALLLCVSPCTRDRQRVLHGTPASWPYTSRDTRDRWRTSLDEYGYGFRHTSRTILDRT